MLRFTSEKPNCNDPAILYEQYTLNNKTSLECDYDRRRIESSQIYFGISMGYGVFVLVTTILFIFFASGPIPLTDPTTKVSNLKKIWKRQTLQKKPVVSTALGALGHFIFCECVFLTQAFNETIGCQLLLWGALIGFYTWMFAMCIRAYMLCFVFRLNRLKVKYLRMSTAERSSCITEKDYQWYLIHQHNIIYTMARPYIVYCISLLSIICIALPCEIHSMKTVGGCNTRWATCLLMALFAFFIAFIVPSLLWCLKSNSDAHGIRTEIWIDALFGIPFFILYAVWFAFVTPSSEAGPYYQHKLFSSTTWIVILTSISHFVSIVLPLLGYIPIQNQKLIKYRDKIARYCRRLPPDVRLFSIRKNSGSSNPQRSHESGINSISPELSIKSLESSLSDPIMMEQLQDLAIRDFSAENLLFYEKYLQLERKVKREIGSSLPYNKHEATTRTVPETKSTSAETVSRTLSRNSWIANNIPKKPEPVATNIQLLSPPATTSVAQQEPELATESESDPNIQNLAWFLSQPIPYKSYPSCVRFYETFIRENSDSQVNISYRARHTVDEKFRWLYEKHPELNPRSEGTNIKKSVLFGRQFRATSVMLSQDKNQHSTVDQEKMGKHEYQHQDPAHVLNLAVFEAARTEVCWNIFTSVYPKLIDMHSNNASF